MRRLLMAVAVIVAVVMVAGMASAYLTLPDEPPDEPDETYTLVDENSIVTIDPSSSGGMYSWQVDGINHLYQQWFWYRIGDTGGEQSLDNLNLLVSNATDRDGDGNYDTLYLKYGDTSSFTIEVSYVLDGAILGSHRSDIGETITITNYSSSPLNFHFFQYSDFNLGETDDDDTAWMKNANTVVQTDPRTVFAETVGTPGPNHYQVDYWPNILDSLEDSDPTTLNNSSGPITGDATWAWQWDETINSNGSFQISKDKRIAPVPEPTTLLLIGSGLIGLAGIGRKRFKR